MKHDVLVRAELNPVDREVTLYFEGPLGTKLGYLTLPEAEIGALLTGQLGHGVLAVYPARLDQAAVTRPVHLIRGWTGNADDETPICGTVARADRFQASRTVWAQVATCPACVTLAEAHHKETPPVPDKDPRLPPFIDDHARRNLERHLREGGQLCLRCLVGLNDDFRVCTICGGPLTKVVDIPEVPERADPAAVAELVSKFRTPQQLAAYAADAESPVAYAHLRTLDGLGNVAQCGTPDAVLVAEISQTSCPVCLNNVARGDFPEQTRVTAQRRLDTLERGRG